KLDLRKRVATTMIQVCKERGKAGDDAARTEGVAFWQWVLNLLEHAGPELMSDEEDLHVLDETIPERPISVAAKEVLSLAWRHPYFTKLFIFIDVTTGLEAMVFQRTGHPSMRRIRTGRESSWPAPKGRPISFYAPIFLKTL
ncbi:hypothetical protein F5050DRAFT_1538658, partial [Lentinula boryana]